LLSPQYSLTFDPRTVAYSVIQPRSTVIKESGYMTVDDVNKALDDLAKTTYSRLATDAAGTEQGEQAKKGSPKVM
jgi:hypothetical protein